ncbi:MAG: hypothetical protein LBI27_02480 [Clostridiales bacterium]|jgi:hypothetical protein|nr:hypothetical protein [Clostridiales bacterium]
MLTEMYRRLVLNYDKGQYSFRDFSYSASDDQLYDLATQLNAFQDITAEKVLKVRVLEF